MQLVSLSADLLRLRNEGFEIEIRDGVLLVHHVPYVNQSSEIQFGTLVSELTLSGDRTTKPGTHVIHFIGEHPCHRDGTKIVQIQHQSGDRQIANGITVNHSFSGRPYDKNPPEYDDYYEKITRYIGVISSPAIAIDENVTAKTFNVIESTDEDPIFHYIDTNSSRAEIIHVSDKLRRQKVGIVGIGGTGSYILDFVAKTRVSEIHLFDGDEFLQHNAFRAPGAASLEELREKPKKVLLHQRTYSKMRKHIYAHDLFMDEDALHELAQLTFVFLAMDKGLIKKLVIDKLEELQIPFIDVGMGVTLIDDRLNATIRTTTSTPAKREHIHEKHRIPFEEVVDDDYETNIQIAELNALNAAFAVIKWKKLCGFYHDSENEHHTSYTLNLNLLLSDDHQN
jgi:hypothetical protein